ncbi:arylsulfatase A [Salpingoeca rosetta]|uniref:Arylsulfatase A n=1 Tax=Salpingoeca rosetta (strain ATCC 50818 / BSB-021) TaxID=946362 RepID=F2UGC9_SALR5|nr:arylsulfatase A [Salpingoeca rosetta]EGD75679.1 arylsulfatase A [Salpingoeca rosetta]|eukprot:XP_004991600.1 arylsulfatase A [Salpingoeca rosetta]
MMMMTKSVMWGCWACVVVVVAGMVTVVSGGVAESKQQRPNIVLILADDLGIGDVGVYPNPQPKAKRLKTPNIDMLAEQGMTFTDAYTGYSVSAPSRWSLMTGYHTGHKEVSSEARLLGNSSITVAHVLREAGYATAAIGKWGLDGNPLLPHPIGDGFPTRQGFDMYYGQSSEIECYNYYPAWMYDSEHNVTIQANRNATPQACGHDYAQCSWSGDLWTQRAVDYITQQATSQHSQKDQRDGETAIHTCDGATQHWSATTAAYVPGPP